MCGLCELECNYQSKGGAIKRRLLKRFISDSYTYYLDKKAPFQIEKKKAKVAIAGGGPAGLMCAYHLSIKGHVVTIFEGSDRLGGALWLIPKYRLPEKVLTSAIDNLVRIAGIQVKYHANVGQSDLTLDAIRKEGFEAVFVGKGTPAPRVLNFGRDDVPGQDLSGIITTKDHVSIADHVASLLTQRTIRSVSLTTSVGTFVYSRSPKGKK